MPDVRNSSVADTRSYLRTLNLIIAMRWHYMVRTHWRRPTILPFREQKPSSAARGQYIYWVAYIYLFFFPWLDGASWARASYCRGFTTTLSHEGMTHLDEWSARRTDLYLTTHNTRHSQQTDVHASGGIRTSNPSKRAARPMPYTARPLGSHIYRCPGGNVPDFGRMFLTLKYTDITQNTYL